jgi:hypothetical protein
MRSTAFLRSRTILGLYTETDEVQYNTMYISRCAAQYQLNQHAHAFPGYKTCDPPFQSSPYRTAKLVHMFTSISNLLKHDATSGAVGINDSLKIHISRFISTFLSP